MRLAVVALLTVACVLSGCSDEPSDQQRLNSVMVGSAEVLSDADSETVSAIGLELVALGVPLREWFEGSAPRETLLERMERGVDRIEGRLTPDQPPEVLATFRPYVTEWRNVIDALERDDMEDYEVAIERLRELDDRRVDRVVEAYGEEVARDLLESEGVDPNR